MSVKQSRAELTAAVERFRKNGPEASLARALRELGEVERKRGDLSAALAAYEEAVELCRAEGETHRLAHWIRHLGDVHREAGEAEEGLKRCREALAIYRRLADAPLGDVANAARSGALAHAECGLGRAVPGSGRGLRSPGNRGG